jgi:hypothetical protein
LLLQQVWLPPTPNQLHMLTQTVYSTLLITAVASDWISTALPTSAAEEDSCLTADTLPRCKKPLKRGTVARMTRLPGAASARL